MSASSCTTSLPKDSVATPQPDCPLCAQDGGHLVWRGRWWRLVRVHEADAAQPDVPTFPAFYRLIWNRHVVEWTDIPPPERALAMQAVALVEQALRQHVQPDKVNLASLGNVVPHMHWHVVARFAWDTHFPAPIWAPAKRPLEMARIQAVLAQLPPLEAELAAALARLEHSEE